MAKKKAKSVDLFTVVDHYDSGIKVFDYKGVRSTQVVGVEKAIDELNKTTHGNPFNVIVHMGTAEGGFINLLADHDISRAAELHTFDVNTKSKNNLFKNVLFHNVDVFEDNVVEDILDTKGRVLLLCDGDNKLKKFNTFVPFLKKDDVIMVHSYVRDTELFEKKYKGTVWNWHSFSDADANLENLEPLIQDVFAPYVWCVRIVK